MGVGLGMANTVHEPPQIDLNRLPDQGHAGNGGWKNLVPAGGRPLLAVEYSPPASSTAIWVVLFAIMMMFAAFTSALVVRKGGAPDWRTFTLPSILYLNTLLLIASSATLEVARRRIAPFVGDVKSQAANPARWLYITMFLGLLFVAGQYVAWQQLRSEGIYLATNPSSSFFYLLTVVHAIHVLGGLAGLTYVIRKLQKSALRRSQLVATARYWHFMGILWVYLLSLLWMKV
jgi:cytochrome c oxidase subunit III